MLMRFVREPARKCDVCPFVGEVFLVALGGKSFRACNVCLCAMERMRVRMHTEGLDALETSR